MSVIRRVILNRVIQKEFFKALAVALALKKILSE